MTAGFDDRADDRASGEDGSQLESAAGVAAAPTAASAAPTAPTAAAPTAPTAAAPTAPTAAAPTAASAATATVSPPSDSTAAEAAAAVSAAAGSYAAGKAKTRKAIVVLIIVLLVVFVFSLCLGRFDLVAALFSGDDQAAATAANVFTRMRLPRVLAAGAVGGMLATAGCAYQGMFRNPMVSPDLLGASAGAGFGAALGILLSLGGVGVQLVAFACGLVAVFIAYRLAGWVSRGLDRVLTLVLCGMVVQNLFQAFTSAVKFVADPNSQLPEITFWLMGGLSNADQDNVLWLLIPMIVGCGVLFGMRWRLNIMSLGDEEARSLGVNVKRTRLVVVSAATLITASAVSVAGMVGWVGLIVPHMARFLVGSDHRATIPVSFLLGSSFLLLVDDICRSIYTVEIPISILTAVIGAPLFIYLIRHRKGM